MKKKDLLKKLNNNTVTDESCKNLIVRITDTLLTFPDNVEIENFTSLNEFFNNGGFNQTRINSDSQPRDIETIQKELEMILNALQDWAKREGQKREVKSVGNDWLCGQQQKNFKASLIFFIVFAVITVAVCVSSILDACGVLTPDGLASGICGSLDFFCGVGFFIDERIRDKKVKGMHDEMSEITTGIICNKKIKVKGNYANFGIQTITYEETEKRILEFAKKYSRNEGKRNQNKDYPVVPRIKQDRSRRNKDEEIE